MHLHRIEIFYHVARCRGIAEAARRMPYGIQQPAISEQILLLEEELGVKLFERRPFRLTTHGRYLYEAARPGLEEIERRYEHLRRRNKSSLRLAAEDGLAHSFLLPAIASLNQLNPPTEITIRSGTASQLRQALEDREIDLAIMTVRPSADQSEGRSTGRPDGQKARRPEDRKAGFLNFRLSGFPDLRPSGSPAFRPSGLPTLRPSGPPALSPPSSAICHPTSSCGGFAGRALATAPLALLIPAASPIQTADHFWTQKTISEQLITPDAAHAICQVFDHGLKQGGLDWPSRMDAGSIASVAPLVAAGLGIGLIADLPGLTLPEGVRVLPLAGFDPVAIACLWRSPETRRLKAVVQTIARQPD